jgi:hypothetical protein
LKPFRLTTLRAYKEKTRFLFAGQRFFMVFSR